MWCAAATPNAEGRRQQQRQPPLARKVIACSSRNAGLINYVMLILTASCTAPGRLARLCVRRRRLEAEQQQQQSRKTAARNHAAPSTLPYLTPAVYVCPICVQHTWCACTRTPSNTELWQREEPGQVCERGVSQGLREQGRPQQRRSSQRVTPHSHRCVCF